MLRRARHHASKFYDWRELYGKANEHNGWVARDFWLEEWEKQAIIGFHMKNPLEGYRRLTFMMLDGDIVAVSPSRVWRELSQAGLLSKWNGKPSKKGKGFAQPMAARQYWHTDVSYAAEVSEQPEEEGIEADFFRVGNR